MQHPNSSQVLRSDSLCKSVLRPRDNTRDKVDGTLQVAGGDDFSVALSCASSVAPAPIAPTKFRNIAHIWAHCLSDKKYQEMIIVYHCYCVCAIRLLYLNHCLRSWSPLQLLRLKLWTDCFSPEPLEPLEPLQFRQDACPIQCGEHLERDSHNIAWHQRHVNILRVHHVRKGSCLSIGVAKVLGLNMRWKSISVSKNGCLWPSDAFRFLGQEVVWQLLIRKCICRQLHNCGLEARTKDLAVVANHFALHLGFSGWWSFSQAVNELLLSWTQNCKWIAKTGMAEHGVHMAGLTLPHRQLLKFPEKKLGLQPEDPWQDPLGREKMWSSSPLDDTLP